MTIVEHAWCATTPRKPVAVQEPTLGSGLKSVGSALDVLECFAVDGELGVSDIARRLGVAKSTAHRLLQTLVSRGFVEQDQTTGQLPPRHPPLRARAARARPQRAAACRASHGAPGCPGHQPHGQLLRSRGRRRRLRRADRERRRRAHPRPLRPAPAVPLHELGKVLAAFNQSVYRAASPRGSHPASGARCARRRSGNRSSSWSAPTVRRIARRVLRRCLVGRCAGHEQRHRDRLALGLRADRAGQARRTARAAYVPRPTGSKWGTEGEPPASPSSVRDAGRLSAVDARRRCAGLTDDRRGCSRERNEPRRARGPTYRDSQSIGLRSAHPVPAAAGATNRRDLQVDDDSPVRGSRALLAGLRTPRADRAADRDVPRPDARGRLRDPALQVDERGRQPGHHQGPQGGPDLRRCSGCSACHRAGLRAPARRLLPPRAHADPDRPVPPAAGRAEVAFVLKKPLKGPGVTVHEAMRAVDFVLPALEIVDRRIRDWKIGLFDTIADNASSGAVVLGSTPTDVSAVDLRLARCDVPPQRRGRRHRRRGRRARLAAQLARVARQHRRRPRHHPRGGPRGAARLGLRHGPRRGRATPSPRPSPVSAASPLGSPEPQGPEGCPSSRAPPPSSGPATSAPT